MSQRDVEILVHIAAPARGVDDSKYRTLASAYLNFEPTTRIPVVLGTPEGCDKVADQGADDVEDVTGPPLSRIGRFLELESPVMSFQSAIDNLGSPRLRHAGESGVAESQLSWRPPPSVVEDSMPNNDFALAQYCTPTRILEHYTSVFTSSQSVSPLVRKRQNSSPSSSSQPTSTSTRQQPIGKSAVNEHVVIPQSPEDNHKRPGPPSSMSSGIVEETRIVCSSASQPVSTTSFRVESEPPPPKRARVPRDPEPGTPLARSASDVGARGTIADASAPLPAALEIISPPPLTARRELRAEDLITDILARLARELNLERRFKPMSQSRDLRPFERGHWLVDCRSWEPELKRSAWGFLTNYLEKGAAGWGTSCRRDPDFAWLRFYCWGCVVGHIYLVLYLASKRRILYTGARWIGGDGGDVIVMGTRPASE